MITSSSNREYTITSPEGTIETRSYQWRQTITFESCAHEDADRGAPATQQLSVDQIFVMFDADNDLIRFAMSNKIGSVHSESTQQEEKIKNKSIDSLAQLDATSNDFPFSSCVNDSWLGSSRS